MAVAISIDAVNNIQNQIVVTGSLALTANYGGGATHGDTVSFLNQDSIKSQTPPLAVDIFETPAAGTSATGYVYRFAPGTTLGNGVMQIFGTGAAAGAAEQEYTQGSAYSAPLLAAVVKFRAYFTRL